MEAKIGKIYQVMDSGNYKEAIKLCLSRDVQHLEIVQALLIFSYSVTRKKTEAINLARSLIAKKPTDETVLATLAQGLKMIRMEDEMIPLYENIITINPFSEQHITELFYAYARKGDAKKMQTLSQKLFKITALPQYVYWTVCSMMQQLNVPNSNANSGMVLTLAERMLTKVIRPDNKENGSTIQQPGDEEFQLYIETLVRQKKFSEALDAFDSLLAPRASASESATSENATTTSVVLPPPLHDDVDFVAHPNSITAQQLPISMLRISVLSKMAQAEDSKEYKLDISRKLNAIYYDVLGSYPDQWDIHQAVIDNLTNINASGSVDDYYNLVVAHQIKLKTMQCGDVKLRGPFLAELELVDCVLSNRHHVEGLPADETVPDGWCHWTGAEGKHFASMQKMQESVLGEDSVSVKPRTLFQEKLLLICQYLIYFGDRQMVVSDIMPYILRLVMKNTQFTATHAGLVNKFLKWLHSSSQESLAALKQIKLVPVKVLNKKTTTSKNNSNPVVDENKPVVETAEEKTNNAARAEAAKLTCAFAKLKQVEYIVWSLASVCYKANNSDDATLGELVCGMSALNTSGSTHEEVSVIDFPASVAASWRIGSGSGSDGDAMIGLYKQSLSLTLGGIGGDREVQTGDEVLALLCSAYHDQHRSIMNGPAQDLLYTNLYHWSQVLVLGQTTSPWNFLFHLERLETCRMMSDVKGGIEAFNKLRTRHVQLESMSYLLLPVLFEYGYFTEAHAQLKSILQFHSSVQYDTGEQIGKAFQFSNYMKCMEMFRFIALCEK